MIRPMQWTAGTWGAGQQECWTLVVANGRACCRRHQTERASWWTGEVDVGGRVALKTAKTTDVQDLRRQMTELLLTQLAFEQGDLIARDQRQAKSISPREA